MDNNYGWGRVNAFAAVSAALTGIGTLEGTISSSGGGTVEGAKIRLTDTGQQVFSDATGHYMLKAVAGDHSVQVSRFGYDAYTTTVSIAADVTTTLDVTLNQLPSGVIAGFVTDFETDAGIAAGITIKYLGDPVLSTSTNPATGEYSITLPVGTYDLVFNPAFPYPMTTRNGIAVAEGATTALDVALRSAQVLIVDDDAGKDFQTYFEQAVIGSGRSYLTVSAPPNAATMALFESVIWLTGNDYTTTLTTADIAEISAYLDGGGRLFMTGQDIGYDIGHNRVLRQLPARRVRAGRRRPRRSDRRRRRAPSGTDSRSRSRAGRAPTTRPIRPRSTRSHPRRRRSCTIRAFRPRPRPRTRS